MSAATAELAFEVVRFSAAAVSADVALLELEGRFRSQARRRLGAPRLLAERGDRRLEVAATAGGEATAEPEGAGWRAAFTLPLEALDDGRFALAVGRELLVDLPAPIAATGPAESHVRLAREANALRARADAQGAARERMAVELATEREGARALSAHVEALEQALDERERSAGRDSRGWLSRALALAALGAAILAALLILGL